MHVGIGTSNGIGIGHALLIDRHPVKFKVTKITDVDLEKKRYFHAKEKFISKTNSMIKDLDERLGAKSAAILKNQIYLVNDTELNKGILSIIESENVCAEAAVDETYKLYIKLFSNMEDDNMSQRAIDIEDVRVRLLKSLMNIEELNLKNLPENTIIVADELAPSITAVMDTEHIVGIIAENGGDTSHASILARALEIPAVLSLRDARQFIKNGDTVIVDGIYGEVFVNPIEKTIQIYQRKQLQYQEKMIELNNYKNKQTLTKDGKQVDLFANIVNSNDIIKVIQAGGEGVGLYRTEFLFMNGIGMPTEEEQFEEYKRALIMNNGKPLVIRTLDIGGDKKIPYMGLVAESNPFLGYRAIRYCLNRVDVFVIQLRAILRASAFGKVKLLIPLITSLDEVVNVKRHLYNIKAELDKQEIPYDKNLELGIMIETPAASLIADILAKEVDFFSIGTNDLIQYTLVVDRGNENVAYIYTPFHPAVLRSIKHIIQCAKAEKIPVAMCGEAAANLKMIPILLAFGLDEFSVTPSSLLETRKAIASWSIDEVKVIEEEVMKFWTDKEINNYLESVIENKRISEKLDEDQLTDK